MAKATPTADQETIYDQLCKAITHAKGVTDASLKTAQVLMWDVGPTSLVGLEAGGERAIYHVDGDEEFVAAFPFDETGVNDDDAELLGQGDNVEEALDEVEYEWVHPGYRESLIFTRR